jgi:uncharacterized protein DUF7009
MKLRINGNSIRLRLGQSEVRRLAIEGTVEELAVFGPSEEERIGYVLCASSESPVVSARFAHRRIIVRVPSGMVHQWATTDQVSIHATQCNGDDPALSILIEKDYQCIDASPGQSREDAFPHPQMSAACRPATAMETSK